MTIVVVGGGPAGLAAAIGSARLGLETYIVEKEELGGFPRKHAFHTLAPTLETYEDVIEPLIKETKEKAKALECIEAVGAVRRSDGKFNVTLDDGRILTADALILALGFEPFAAESMWIYKSWLYPDVIPSWKLEEMLNPKGPTKGVPMRPSDGKRADEIAIIFCAGSRDRVVGVPYCSAVCCGYSCKQAIEIKEANPEAKVHLFYMDVRTVGEEESLYWKAQEEYGAHFVRGKVAGLEKVGDKLVVSAEDTLLNKRVEIPVDLVSLDVAMTSSKTTREFSQKLGIELTENKFIKATRAVETSVPGVFVAGTASGPKTIEMSMSEGFAASALVASYLKK